MGGSSTTSSTLAFRAPLELAIEPRMSHRTEDRSLMTYPDTTRLGLPCRTAFKTARGGGIGGVCLGRQNGLAVPDGSCLGYMVCLTQVEGDPDFSDCPLHWCSEIIVWSTTSCDSPGHNLEDLEEGTYQNPWVRGLLNKTTHPVYVPGNSSSPLDGLRSVGRSSDEVVPPKSRAQEVLLDVTSAIQSNQP